MGKKKQTVENPDPQRRVMLQILVDNDDLNSWVDVWFSVDPAAVDELFAAARNVEDGLPIEVLAAFLEQSIEGGQWQQFLAAIDGDIGGAIKALLKRYFDPYGWAEHAERLRPADCTMN